MLPQKKSAVFVNGQFSGHFKSEKSKECTAEKILQFFTKHVKIFRNFSKKGGKSGLSATRHCTKLCDRCVHKEQVVE